MKSAVSVLFLSVLASFSSVSAFAKTSQESINFSKGADQKIQTGSFKGSALFITDISKLL